MQALFVAPLAILCLPLFACGDIPDTGNTAPSPIVDTEERQRSILGLPNAVPRAAALVELLESIGPGELPAVERAIDPVHGLRGLLPEVSRAAYEGSIMGQGITYIGLDVHKRDIRVFAQLQGRKRRIEETIPHDPRDAVGEALAARGSRSGGGCL